MFKYLEFACLQSSVGTNATECRHAEGALVVMGNKGTRSLISGKQEINSSQICWKEVPRQIQGRGLGGLHPPPPAFSNILFVICLTPHRNNKVTHFSVVCFTFTSWLIVKLGNDDIHLATTIIVSTFWSIKGKLQTFYIAFINFIKVSEMLEIYGVLEGKIEFFLTGRIAPDPHRSSCLRCKPATQWGRKRYNYHFQEILDPSLGPRHVINRNFKKASSLLGQGRRCEISKGSRRENDSFLPWEGPTDFDPKSSKPSQKNSLIKLIRRTVYMLSGRYHYVAVTSTDIPLDLLPVVKGCE